MRRFIPLVFAFLAASSTANAFEGQRTFMPPNDLDKEELDGGLTEAQFNAVMDRVQAIYAPIISTNFGATLTINRRWTDNTVNASAEQPTATTWKLNMYGGLARRPEVTEDGFAMVVCHELGHHLAGFPFVQAWAANEGQSDLYATSACAAKLFTMNLELAAIANDVLPQEMKDKCDAAHPENEREVCYRAMVAGKSLADLLAALGNSGAVDYMTPDTTTVTRTNNNHPAAQCRLDTYIAGALCDAKLWRDNLIPAKGMANRNTLDAQNEAYTVSCPTGPGARPRCWFAPITNDTPPPGDEECPLGDPALCDLICQIDPSQPWCAE